MVPSIHVFQTLICGEEVVRERTSKEDTLLQVDTLKIESLPLYMTNIQPRICFSTSVRSLGNLLL